MYDWDTAYVSKILHDPVYAGNLIVAERPTKTMRSKKRQYIPFAEREVIYGTHEPIIEQNRWDNVQKILQSRPPIIGESSSGYDNIFRGIIKCADCGSAMRAKVKQNIEQFAEQISGYAGITELNFKIINQLIEKILVSEPVEIDGQKIQRLTIHYKFIGALETLE